MGLQRLFLVFTALAAAYPDIAMVIETPFIDRENGEVVINCISEFPDSAEMNTAPGPFTIKANADGNLENQLGTELGPGQISAFIAAQVVGDNRFGKQMRMNRGNWRVGVFVCSNPDLDPTAKVEGVVMSESAALRPLSFTPRLQLGDTNSILEVNLADEDSIRDINNIRWGHTIVCDPLDTSPTMQLLCNFPIPETFNQEDTTGLTHVIEEVGTRSGGHWITWFDDNIINGPIDQIWDEAVMAPIVQKCPEGRWGLPESVDGNELPDGSCENECPPCRNGGVCNEDLGECICAPGFSGETCEEFCPQFRWGQNCDLICDTNAFNFFPCRRKVFCLFHPYGCSCMTGFRGLDCTRGCRDGTFGADCLQECHCAEGGCNSQTGVCNEGNCALGWTGPNCQRPCDDGFYGQFCSEVCGFCEGGEPCDKVTGQCDACEIGYQRGLCQDECELNSWGLHCINECHCDQDIQCEQSTGNCPGICAAGWSGPSCNSTCPIGSYGNDCEEFCGFCENDEGCSQINGVCESCEVGFQPPLCVDVCDFGKWGDQCERDCHCAAGDCDLITGACDSSLGGNEHGCAPGWLGENCQEPCQSGMCGHNCETMCGACASGTCEATDCSCNGPCVSLWSGEFCEIGRLCQADVSPCINNSTCHQTPGTEIRECICVFPWEGEFCNRGGCKLQPCQNFGRCKDLEELDEFGKDYECICPMNYNGTNCEFYSGPAIGVTLGVIFSIFITMLVMSTMTTMMLRRRNQNYINSSIGNTPEAVKKRPPLMIPRNDGVILSDHKSGMQDPYRNTNRDSRAKIQRLPPMYDGDPVEDFEWHDKAKRATEKIENSNRDLGAQRIRQIIENEFNT